MAYVKWIFYAVLLALVVGFLDYTLPHREVLRLTQAYNKRVDFGTNSIFWSHVGSGDAVNTVSRFVFFISGVTPNGKEKVFRNQDTGWVWPPYFKFNSADLQARAADLVSTKDKPQWVVVRYYGWRSNLLSIFPNAVTVYPVDSPNVRLIPWFNIVVIVLLLALFRTIQVRVRRVWRRWFGAPGKA